MLLHPLASPELEREFQKTSVNTLVTRNVAREHEGRESDQTIQLHLRVCFCNKSSVAMRTFKWASIQAHMSAFKRSQSFTLGFYKFCPFNPRPSLPEKKVVPVAKLPDSLDSLGNLIYQQSARALLLGLFQRAVVYLRSSQVSVGVLSW